MIQVMDLYLMYNCRILALIPIAFIFWSCNAHIQIQIQIKSVSDCHELQLFFHIHAEETGGKSVLRTAYSSFILITQFMMCILYLEAYESN